MNQFDKLKNKKKMKKEMKKKTFFKKVWEFDFWLFHMRSKFETQKRTWEVKEKTVLNKDHKFLILYLIFFVASKQTLPRIQSSSCKTFFLLNFYIRVKWTLFSLATHKVKNRTLTKINLEQPLLPLTSFLWNFR